ncbi:MAG: glutaredoxin domain-containing protein [Gammaproteobacteria bacterium]
MTDAKYTIYWQPGCTSCLKAKEFLASRGIPYRSVNVHAQPEALEHLASIGVRSVPVVERGDGFVMAQNLDELASFLGVAPSRVRLGLTELATRLKRVMAVALAQLDVIPAQLLSQSLRRDRTVRDLGFHVYAIVEGFLEAAQGGTLSEAHFYRLPDPKADVAALRQYVQAVTQQFATWWERYGATAQTQSYATYYGDQTAIALLERTCWHTAQHCRQMDAFLKQAGVQPLEQLSPADLAGLPVPEHVWDDELPMLQSQP